MRQTLYAKIVLAAALTYYAIFFAVVSTALFLLGEKAIVTNVLEVIGAAAALASLILHLLGKKWGKVMFTFATMLVVVSQLVGAGFVLWANCVAEVFFLFLVVLLRFRKIK